MGNFGVYTRDGISLVLKGGTPGQDCSRFDNDSDRNLLDWNNTTDPSSIYICKDACNHWLLRNYGFDSTQTVYDYIESGGVRYGISGIWVGKSWWYSRADRRDYFTDSYDHFDPPTARPQKGEAYTSTLSCSNGGSVAFKYPTTLNSTSTAYRAISSSNYNSNTEKYHLGGELVGFVATPNSHWRVKRWTLNNVNVAGYERNNHLWSTFPSAQTLVYCDFEQYQWSFTAKSGSSDAIGVITGAVTNVYKDLGSVIALEAFCQDTANYRFAGWYCGYGVNLDAESCNEFVSSEAKLNFSMVDRDVTIVAKFASRETKLVVGVTGDGTFKLTVNDELIGEGLTSHNNDNARDGWTVVAQASPNNNYYFSNWLLPSGSSGEVNVYEASVTLTLPPREENRLLATFLEKVLVNITGEVLNEGEVSYSGGQSAGGTFDDSAVHVTSDTYIETDYAFVARPKSRLYAFEKWQYLVGETWADMNESSFPERWVRSINGETLIICVRERSITQQDVHHIRAVFKKLNTYAIKNLTIEGSHPINQTLASDGGCTYSGLPEADEIGEDGENRWIEGTQISLSPIAGAKWVYDKAVGVMVVGTEEVELDSPSFVLNGNVEALQLQFKARTYKVKTSTSNASSGVGYATFEYYINSSETLVVDEADDVYIDTDIIIRANTNDGISSSDVAFYDWSLNGVAMPYTAEQAIAAVTEDMTFVAQFAVRNTFQYDGSKVINDKTYNFGKVNIAYEKNGVSGYPLELPAEGTSVDLMLRCGSSLSLVATALKIDDGSVQLQGFFTGWSELINGSWTPVTGWTETVETTATMPRTIKASFNDSEVWPILRLRNFAETQDYCNFSVSGVLEDRQQTIGDEVIQLTNEFDFFCKPFSTIRIALIKTSETRRFIRWQRFSFNLADETSEVVEDADFSDVQDLSFVITNDTSLRPEFYTGGAVSIPVSFTNGSETFGNVAIEGDYVSVDDSGHKAFIQGDEITLVASPNNGYKFVGWYANQYGEGVPLSDSSFYTITVGSSMTWYYAKFEQDANAIYKFGVSNEPKQAHWSSKRIMVNTPISFSTAQVDAEGYEGMTLDVYHSSSPDKPAKHETYEVKNSNSRRLQAGRPEKLFEFSIKSTTPINFMSFSTSVTGLIGGA